MSTGNSSWWPTSSPANLSKATFLLAGLVSGILFVHASQYFSSSSSSSDSATPRDASPNNLKSRRKSSTRSSSSRPQSARSGEGDERRQSSSSTAGRGSRPASAASSSASRPGLTERRTSSRTLHPHPAGYERPAESRVVGAPEVDEEDLVDEEGDEENAELLMAEALEGRAVVGDDSQNLLTLLYSIAEDQARKDGYVHRSITCNHCGLSPLRGTRYKCANCVDYDVCELCESQDVHIKTHAFVKIRIPIPPLMNPRTALLNSFYPGVVDGTFDRSGVDFGKLQQVSHFDVVELEAFHDQFLSLSTTPQGIDKETFERCLGPLGLEKNLIIERIFKFFDRDGNSIISYEELILGLSVLCKGGLDERIKWAFKGYDLNDDGIISRDELHQMFKAYFHLSMELVRDVVKTMEEGMMESFDDEASKPVSASFAAPSTHHNPSSSSHRHEEGDEEEEEESVRRELQKRDMEDVYASFAAGTERWNPVVVAGSSMTTSPSIANPPSYAVPSHTAIGTPGNPFPTNTVPLIHNSTPAATQATRPRRVSNVGESQPPPSATAGTSTQRRTLSLRRSLPHLSTSSPLRMSLDPSSPHYYHSLVNLGSPSSASATTGPTSPIHAQSLPRRQTWTSIPPSTPNSHPHQTSIPEEHNYQEEEQEEQWPIMESMSQAAIEEMVDKTFALAGLGEFPVLSPHHTTLPPTKRKEKGPEQNVRGLTFEDFRRVVEVDSNLLAWFEALGSVF
ncbi:hypothetical protein DFS34DRAFT_605545 [Phlyctochytrium arcticum]|nr:hypothetical protein DFS34DRAFT_605545 [Phlyctochytrium arcticum]